MPIVSLRSVYTKAYKMHTSKFGMTALGEGEQPAGT